MKFRQRLVVGALWFGVAGLMALTLYPFPALSVGVLVRLFVAALALFLAFVYVFDPRGVLGRQPFH